jgi:peptidoglycan hydrolase-like protein with peptidoglycan-binding domain
MTGLIQRGSRGPEVSKLQAKLNRLLKPTPLLIVDGDFGARTERSVREFQRRESLAVDGVVGPKTWARLEQATLIGGGKPDAANPGATSAIAEQAVQIALTQEGVREDPLGSNRGPRVDQYIRAAGEEPPQLWCMAFVYWCFGEAATRLGVPHPMQGVPAGQKDYCTGVYAWARQNNLTASSPQRGDIFLVQGGSEGRTHQHTGIVTESEGGLVSTIEGNTNTDGSSNGIGVFRRTRSTSRLDYVRLSS